jgi:hypothetical protein
MRKIRTEMKTQQNNTDESKDDEEKRLRKTPKPQKINTKNENTKSK